MECLRACVIIQELEVQARIGCTAEERAAPQRLQISAQLELRPPADARRMTLDDSVDYSAVASRIAALIVSKEWELTEHVSAETAALILREYPRVDVACIETRKFALAGAAWAGSTLTARRGKTELR